MTERTWLQRRPFRSVALERDADGAPIVVKRFHDPRVWRRVLDPWRALREHRVLTALERDALPVPRSRGIRRGREGWEVAMDAVPGARSLEAWSDDPGTPPGGWPALAERLGAALATLARLGWRHPDPTLRNVLVDGAGHPWAIDWAGGRRTRPSRAAAWSTLVALAAPLRERWSRPLRRRALRAWWQALPEELRPEGSRRAVAARAEEAARAERARQVSAGLGRWLRPSSRVRRIERDGDTLLVRADVSEGGLALVLEGRRPHRRVEGTRADVERAWLAAARLHEHRLPALRPVVLVRGRNASVALLEPPERPAPDRDRVVGWLADRGLAVDPGALATGPGGAWVDAPTRVRPAGTKAGGTRAGDATA